MKNKTEKEIIFYVRNNWVGFLRKLERKLNNRESITFVTNKIAEGREEFYQNLERRINRCGYSVFGVIINTDDSRRTYLYERWKNA